MEKYSLTLDAEFAAIFARLIDEMRARGIEMTPEDALVYIVRGSLISYEAGLDLPTVLQDASSHSSDSIASALAKLRAGSVSIDWDIQSRSGKFNIRKDPKKVRRL